MAIRAIVHKTSLEARFDSGDDGFIDVALALFLARGLDVEVDQFLAIDDPDPEFLRLGGVE